MYVYRITPSAYRDLSEIKRYIREELSSPERADLLIQAFMKAFENACMYPFSLPPVQEPRLQARGYRKIIVKNYIAFVQVRGETVEIMRVLYYGRDYQRLL